MIISNLIKLGNNYEDNWYSLFGTRFRFDNSLNVLPNFRSVDHGTYSWSQDPSGKSLISQHFFELGTSIGEENKKHYLNLNQSDNPNWNLLDKEAIDSHNQQKRLENKDGESFESFVENYFKY